MLSLSLFLLLWAPQAPQTPPQPARQQPLPATTTTAPVPSAPAAQPGRGARPGVPGPGPAVGGDIDETPVVTHHSISVAGRTINYTATAAHEALTFLSIGTPTGYPPIATLDGVSLTQVPEPASLAVLGAGIGLLGLVMMRRRNA